MDVDRLRAVLSAAGCELTARETAEALWLAGRVPGQPGTPAPPRESPAERAGETPAVFAAPGRLTGVAAGGDDVPVHVPGAGTPPAGRSGRPISVDYVRTRTGSALRSARDLMRATRPLRRGIASRTQWEFDEDATAQRFAECRRWLPVMRPAITPAFDLTLVIDHSPASRIWADTADELALLLAQSGTFGRVRTRYLTVRPDGGLNISGTRATGSPGGRAGGIGDPSDRDLMLLLTDGVAAAWQGGPARRVLGRWSRHGRLAIVQPLPERLWSRTGLPPDRGRLRLSATGPAGRRLTFLSYETPAPTTAVVPVLHLDPGWLGSWSRLMAEVAPDGVDGAAVILGPDDAPAAAGEPPAGLTAVARVRRFRAEAAPEAFELARYLAAVPLTRAVMRVVQAAMLPDARLAHLAEVWFSGLLTQVGSTLDEPVFSFVAGVEDVLLGMLREDELEEIQHRVSRYLQRQADAGRSSFLLAVPTTGGAHRLSPLSRPFARISARVRAKGAGLPESTEPAPAGTLVQVGTGEAPRLSGPTALTGKGDHALLIGVTRHGHLPDLPAAREQLASLGEALVSACGLRPPHLRIVLDPEGPDTVLREIAAAAGRASGTLLLYYLGHGTRPRHGDIELVTAADGVALADVRALLADRTAPTVMILDACATAGRALDPLPNGLLLYADTPPDSVAGPHEGYADRLAGLLRDEPPPTPRGWTLGDVGAALALRSAEPDPPPPIPALALTPREPPKPAKPTTARGRAPVPARVTSAKVVIAGGPGTGRRRLIGAVSEITPLTTKAVMTAAAGAAPETTTVAMEFGRISIDRDLLLYLFSTPGETRLWFMWDELVRGAIGAIVLVDSRRLADCFAAVDFFEHRRLPYLVAVDVPDGRMYHPAQDIRDALAIGADVPVTVCDTGDQQSVKLVIIALVEYVMTLRWARPTDGATGPR
jgi:signal recognition particle receptor subunit beta